MRNVPHGVHDALRDRFGVVEQVSGAACRFNVALRQRQFDFDRGQRLTDFTFLIRSSAGWKTDGTRTLPSSLNISTIASELIVSLHRTCRRRQQGSHLRAEGRSNTEWSRCCFTPCQKVLLSIRER
jgi:hypothetical protein